MRIWELKLDLELNLLLYRHRLGSDYCFDSGVSFWRQLFKFCFVWGFKEYEKV